MTNITPAFIYFDLDDTLLHHKQAEQQALRDLHCYFDLFDSVSAEQLIASYHQVNAEQWLKYSRGEVSRSELQRNRFELTLQELELDESRYDEVGAQYMEYYQMHWQWRDGAKQAFQKIRNSFKVGILTNGFAETQKKKFEKFGLYDQADHLVITENIGKLKPHPKVFEYATALVGCQPDDILYVGDSYSSDVIGGTEFGWKVAWFTTDGETEQRKQADFVFDDFNDLTDLLKV